jgi:hypothetical protein
MTLEFPSIDYDFWLVKWSDNLLNKAYHLTEMDSYSPIKSNITEKECEDEIRVLIRNIQNPELEKDSVLRVVDLIYRWGGPSGRMFYIAKNKPRKKLQLAEDLFGRYCDAIELAKKGKSSSKFLFQSIPGIGSSFASKHAAFWSYYSPTPLIVIDSKIAGCFGFENLEELEKEISFDEILLTFKMKGKLINLNIQDVEKALFTFHKNYFNNENDGWNPKPTEIVKDKLEAERLALILGFNTL